MTASQKNSSATNEVSEYVKKKIYSGYWKPGDKLPSEFQLGKQMDASRTSVRCALSYLSGLGLVESRQGSGTFVCKPHIADPLSHIQIEKTDRLSIFEFRKIMESESAALSALRASAEDIEEMDKTILLMEFNSSNKDVAGQDMQFHFLIAKTSGNSIIQHIFKHMESIYLHMFEDNVSHMGNIGAKKHRQILLDIQVRNPEAARQHMLEHISDTMRYLLSQ